MFGIMDAIRTGRGAVEAQTAAWLEMVAEFDRSEEWRLAGYYSASVAIADVCRMDKGVAAFQVKLARKLEKLPVVAAAFADGAISQRHATVIADAATPARMPEFGNFEAEFVDVARKCPPKELVQVVEYVTDALDGDGGVGAEEKLFEQRHYHASRTLDGTLRVDGVFAPEAADMHETALRIARERDQRVAETRTLQQRNADAITMIMAQWLELSGANTPDQIRRHLVGVIDLSRAEGVSDDLVAEARAERHQNGHLSRATLERLACDCHFSRVIMDGASEVLDAGRSTRTATDTQYRALIARDGRCQAPGCHEPPERCRAHHKWHWTRGGPTDLDNLELLCWAHHRQRHIEDARARGPSG